MNKENLALILASVFLAVLSFIAGVMIADSVWHEKLAQEGHAEYYLDANNERQWRLKELK